MKLSQKRGREGKKKATEYLCALKERYTTNSINNLSINISIFASCRRAFAVAEDESQMHVAFLKEIV